MQLGCITCNAVTGADASEVHHSLGALAGADAADRRP